MFGTVNPNVLFNTNNNYVVKYFRRHRVNYSGNSVIHALRATWWILFLVPKISFCGLLCVFFYYLNWLSRLRNSANSANGFICTNKKHIRLSEFLKYHLRRITIIFRIEKCVKQQRQNVSTTGKASSSIGKWTKQA